MKSSPIIALFGDPPPSRRGPSAFLISLVLHACAFGLLFAGLRQPRKADLKSDVQRYSVRVMELHPPEPKERRLVQSYNAQSYNAQAGQQTDTHTTEPGGAPEQAAAARIPLNFLVQKQAVQTLFQPDVRRDLLIPQAALPQVFEWSPPDIAVTRIVPPPPQTVAEIKVQPVLDPPNRESRVADVKIAATAFDTKAPLPEPSKTSPVNVQVSGQVQQVPGTVSKDSTHPTPASIISLSDIKLQEGTATLPMISEVAPAPFSGSLSPGQLKGLSQTGSGKTDSKLSGTSAGPTSGDQAGKVGAASGPVGQSGANGQPLEVDGIDSGASQRTVVHISVSKDGKFGVVVVGSSLAEDYPETVDMWSGRLAYTVYLHVGVAKNWIMQYSLPRSQGIDSTGTAARPDAPWPYDITRPSIDADVNADAIMVHGFVNALGRFEQLSVIFPTELAETKFLLHALQQWQFRPAVQNGKATPVEVLLIIPDETE